MQICSQIIHPIHYTIRTVFGEGKNGDIDNIYQVFTLQLNTRKIECVVPKGKRRKYLFPVF